MTFQELKDRNPIVDVAVRLELIRTARDTTQAFKCFHHEDRNPSAVLMPNVNRYRCQSCGKGGDVFDLIQGHLGMNSPLEAAKWLDPTFGEENWEKETPDTWLKSHPLSEETRQKYKFQEEADAVSFEVPGYGTKTRQFGERRKMYGKFHNPAGSAENFVLITDPEKEVQFVVEGEVDAMVLTSNTGYSAATKTTGSGSAQALVEKLAGKEAYVVTDNDPAGKQYAEKIVASIPTARVVILPSGIKDISEFFYRNYTKDDFDRLVISATDPEPTKLVLETGYSSLDVVLGGLHSGGMYLIAGEEKSGKTSLVLSFIKNFVESGNPVLYISTELKEDDVSDYLNALSGESNWGQKHPDFQLCDVEEAPTLEEHIKFIEEKARVGVRIFVVDNVTSYRDESKLGKGEWERISQAGDSYRRLARKKGLLMLAVIHLNRGTVLREIPTRIKELIEKNEPGRIFDESVAVFRKPDADDVKGGSGMRSQTQGLILLWRPFQSFYSPKLNKLCSVIVASNRYGPTSGDVRFTFDGANKRFVEVNPTQPAPDLTPTPPAVDDDFSYGADVK